MHGLLMHEGVLKNGQSFQLEGVTWTAFRDKAAKATYYYNNKTGASQWEDPRIAAKARGKAATLQVSLVVVSRLCYTCRIGTDTVPR